MGFLGIRTVDWVCHATDIHRWELKWKEGKVKENVNSGAEKSANTTWDGEEGKIESAEG